MVRIMISCWIEFIYEVWNQRNGKPFDNKLNSVGKPTRSTLFKVACRTKNIAYSHFV